MKVLYFSRTYGPHDHRFLTAIAGLGHEVSYLKLGGPPDVSADGLPQGVEPVAWEGGRRPVRLLDGFRLRAGLRSVIAQRRPDVIHAGPVQSCAFLAAWAGAQPLLTMSWGSDVLVSAAAGIGRRTASWTLARSELLLCDCHAVSRAAQALGMPESRIIVFPWGVDLMHFRPGADSSLRAELGWKDAIVLLSARSMESQYGLETLVDGFIQAARNDPRLRLLALGDGSLRSRLTERVSNAHLLDRVHWAGTVPVERLPAYYRAADWYVSASMSDGSSVALLEAMACGLPAVVSDIPGNREWVEHGVNGMLFPVDKPDALAGRLTRAGAMTADRVEWGNRSRAITEARADWRAGVEKLQSAYERAVREGRRP